MRRLIASSFISVLGCTLLASCATEQYQYVPAERPVNNDRRTNQAIYAEPANSPTGSVRVSSMGVVDIKPPDSPNTVPALHVKVAVSNEHEHGDWVFNAQDQFVALPNQTEVRPLMAKSDTSNSQTIVVQPGQLRSIELFFPLQGLDKSAKTLPEFDFHWQLRAGEQLVKQTTLFDRITIPDAPAVIYPYGPYPYAMGWGPVGWGGVAYPY